MKSVPPLLSLGLGLTSATTLLAQTVTVDFADIALAPESYFQTAPGGSTTLASQGALFAHTTPSWGGFSAFTVSNQTDTTTAGYLNPASAFAGGGDGDANYGVAYVSSGLAIDFSAPGGVTLQSIALTNTTYAALSMLHGDDFAKQFGGATGTDPDFLRLTITAYDAADTALGAVEFFLADYRSADPAEDYVVDTWTILDLGALGSGIASLGFALDSSDNGDWGMNTPSYFAFDSLTFTAVPEPGALAGLLGLGALAGALRRRRR